MKRSVYEQEQGGESKTRLRMLQHAETSSHNVSQTCRFIGISRAQFYIWRHRFEKKGVKGLRDVSRRPNNMLFRTPSEVITLILRVRAALRYGAVRMSL
jgi:transposase-like protein